jgi:hypothetical protein
MTASGLGAALILLYLQDLEAKASISGQIALYLHPWLQLAIPFPRKGRPIPRDRVLLFIRQSRL